MLDEKNMMIIIGASTETTVNIFVGYANCTNVSDKLIAQCLNINDEVINIQELKPYKNYTTVFHILNLKPMITYSFQIMINMKGETISKTINISTTPKSLNKITIGLCSCHYPNPLQVSDKIFKAIINVLDSYKLPCTPVIFQVGDQVYADQLNRLVPISRVDQHSEFIKLYENKYTGKHFSNFSSKFSSLMTLDDHEIEDNWSSDRVIDKRDLFLSAMTNYKLYQASHSSLLNKDNLNINESPLFYSANIGIFPFFILDTRTERHNNIKKLISDTQLECLLKWLGECDPNLPKFIVSSVIFAPFTSNAGSSIDKDGIYDGCDNWNGYLTKNVLLKFIIDNNIQKVVFLSGDIHNSLAGTIFLERQTKVIKIYQIISSPLFWPFPFANGSIDNYILDTKDLIKSKISCMREHKKNIKIKVKDSNSHKWKYRYEFYADTHTQHNNFAILDIDANRVHVKWFGNTGNIIKTHDIVF